MLIGPCANFVTVPEGDSSHESLRPTRGNPFTDSLDWPMGERTEVSSCVAIGPRGERHFGHFYSFGSTKPHGPWFESEVAFEQDAS